MLSQLSKPKYFNSDTKCLDVEVAYLEICKILNYQLFQFCFSEQTESHMKEWKYSESYGVLRSKHRLGPKLNFATALVKYYATLILTAEIEIVVSVLAELDELVWFYFTDNSSDLCKYAKQLHGDKKYVESVLFYYIAFSTLKKETDLSTFPTLTFKICNGIMESVDSLKQEYLITANMVECYFIPFFRKCINAVRKKMIYNPKG